VRRIGSCKNSRVKAECTLVDRNDVVRTPPLTDGSPSYWAFGWRAGATGDKTAIKKVTMNGGLPGVASTIVLYPDQKIGIVSLSNFRTKGGVKIAEQIAKLIIPADRAPQEVGTMELGNEEEEEEEEEQAKETKSP
jgi:hypothetical protein